MTPATVKVTDKQRGPRRPATYDREAFTNTYKASANSSPAVKATRHWQAPLYADQQFTFEQWTKQLW